MASWNLFGLPSPPFSRGLPRFETHAVTRCIKILEQVLALVVSFWAVFEGRRGHRSPEKMMPDQLNLYGHVFDRVPGAVNYCDGQVAFSIFVNTLVRFNLPFIVRDVIIRTMFVFLGVLGNGVLRRVVEPVALDLSHVLLLG